MSFGTFLASHSPSRSACFVVRALAASQATMTRPALIRLGKSFGSNPKLSFRTVSKSAWSLATTANCSTVVTPMW